MYMNQQDAQNLYFLLNVLHVSDYISPSSGANFISCTSHLVYADTNVQLLCGYSHTTARSFGVYQMRCTAYKVAPDDGLIQSEICRASNGK